MHHNIKAAIIIAVGLVIAVLAYQYFSPYSRCVRGEEAKGGSSAAIRCAVALGGRH
jgi:hypothetical protein